ncbi:hypothetical protein OOZ54_12795 [Rhodopseudomonas palustris]|uniref:hypothetical protein n=1 Tax=Rhodopseudomonas palustris TaxID=1076 RepID=UPI0022EFEBCA|nr:hypothetical protein [Rhodopseudomonas palustris]WBU27572.1 hypothetical protein OOZ54_12795 [Rhodopseudomonas palustris]
MHSNTIKGLLLDAAAALIAGHAAVAHRLVCSADRLAVADPSISTTRRDLIATARVAVASVMRSSRYHELA